MSTATLVSPAHTRGRVTQGHVARSEWTKLWSLRSTRWSLLAAVVSMIGVSVLVAAVQMSRWTSISPHERARFDSIDCCHSPSRVKMCDGMCNACGTSGAILA